MTRAATFVLLLMIGVVLVGSPVVMAQDEPRTAPSSASAKSEAGAMFARRVAPLLQQKCVGCHGERPDDIAGGLDLRSRSGALKGGDSGEPALVPGDPDKSPLFVAVTWRDKDLQMPPQERNRLSEEEVATIRRWIAAGAPWPEPTTETPDPASAEEGILVATSGGQSPEWTNRRYSPADLWAYQPARRVPVPLVGTDAVREANPVDAFLQQKLGEAGLRSAPPADRLTFIRRATFDLTGLPPTPREIDEFLADDSPRAAGSLIDRLLASPQYGEQMARRWLDVVRYADTSGFSNDFERPNAWRYRDYVVRSFNDDKPYDRFVLEQLAGDELDPADPELAIAVGFLRMGPWEHTGMTVAAVTRQQYLDDVTHHVGTVLLAQGLRCAGCHDHKFDPVPTRDYYRMQAVFASTQFAERDISFLPAENIAGFEEGKAILTRRLQEVEQVLDQIRDKNRAAIAEYLRERGVDSFDQLPKRDESRRDLIGLTKHELSLKKVYEKHRQYIQRELLRYEPYAFSVYAGPDNGYTSNKAVNPLPDKTSGMVPVVHVLTGGALDAPAEPVAPGVLSAMASSNGAVSPGEWSTIPETTEGRRLALARWIVSPENTLTARVIVNRIWQWHFGKGLVSTPNNFGRMGGRPTHPELLDWLAVNFVEEGWSLKNLHRLIMTSAAYRQSGEHPEAERLLEADPNNELIAYFPPRRLAAEEIRDGLLAVSGELNPEIGGPGIFPEINREVAFQPRHIMGSVAPAYQPSPTPAQRNRRTLYAFRLRTLADPLLEVFNRPGSEVSCAQRDETTVTPQVFALFNGEFAHDRSLALAVTLEKHSTATSGRIVRAFRLVYGRPPPPDELRTCEEHVARMTAWHREHEPRPTELPLRITRHMVEEQTGEEFSWTEELDGMRNYRRDLKPWDVGPETRALADLCLVLLNSNEFLYVR